MEKNKKRNYAVDILKFICIILVIMTHSGFSDEQRLILGFPFWIDMAIPIFMIISGYLWTKSNIKSNRYTIKELYNIKFLIKKALRFIIPFFVALIIEEVVIGVYNNQFDIKSVIKNFIIGGQGPGSYYTPIMLQFILLFPLIYLCMKKVPAIRNYNNVYYEFVVGINGSFFRCF